MRRDIIDPDPPRTPPEPTADEKKNGWTAESLADYLRQRGAERVHYATNVKDRTSNLVIQNINDFDPHSWGG